VSAAPRRPRSSRRAAGIVIPGLLATALLSGCKATQSAAASASPHAQAADSAVRDGTYVALGDSYTGPRALVDPPKGQQAGRPSKSLTLEQTVALMAAAKGTALEAYIVLSLLSGVRTEEARAGLGSRRGLG
jgi:hypothetical protein